MNPLNYNLRQQTKAIVAAAIAALGTLQASLPEGITTNEWIGVVIAGLVGYGAVFGVSNGEDHLRD